MKKIRIKEVPKMQYGGGSNPYIPYVTGMPQAPVTPAERTQWNQVAGRMRQQPGTGARNWDHNKDFQNDFVRSQGMDPNRVQAIQQDMLERSKSMPGTVSYGAQGMSGADNFLGSKTKDQRYVQYQYEHLDSHGNRYQGAAGFTDRGTEPMSQDEMNNWSNSAYRQASKPHEWMTNDQGVLMNASQDQIDTLYQNKPVAANAADTSNPWTSSVPRMGNSQAAAPAPVRKPLPATAYEDGPPVDYSVDAVRSGSNNTSAAYGGIRRKVRVTHTPYGRDFQDSTKGGTMPPHAQFGGQQSSSGSYPGGTGQYAAQQKGHGYGLNRFWTSPAGGPGADPQMNPYSKVGNTLPEAQGGGDINAEKQERVLGDFDQDGSMELMNVNGTSHTEGGKDINVPANSFVYSDTKDLKIKDANVLAMFGLQPKRGGYTPAEVAKRYDVNKYKTTLDNPDADSYLHTTAQLMTDSYMAKLNKLALIQEQMKNHMGMPNSAQQTAKYGGKKFQSGGSTNPYINADNEDANAAVAQTVNPVYNMYPNVLTADGYNHQRPTADNMQSFIQQSINPRPQDYGKPIIPNTDAGNSQYDAMRRAGWNGYEVPGAWAQREQPFAVNSTIQNSGTSGAASDAVTGNDMGNSFYGPRWQGFAPQGPDWNPTIQNVTGMGNSTPTNNLPAPNSQGQATTDKNGKTTIDKGSYTVPVGQDSYAGHRLNPNFLANMFNVLQMGQVHKFKPWEPVPQAVIPDTVFMDPTRAIAAQQEEARSASDLDYMGDQRAARATGLARQGIAGKQAADVIGQYANQNVGIANQANQQAAAITNDLYQRQANRISELNKAGFLADRDYQREMGRLQAEMIDRGQKQHDTNVKTAWLNKTSPFFNVNPIDQMPDFKSERAQSEFYKQVYGIGAGTGSGGGNGDKETQAAAYAQKLMQSYPGMNMETAAKWARQEYGLMGRESEVYKPGAMTPTMRYTGLPVGAGQPNTFGIPQYEGGGMVEPKKAKLKKYVKIS